MCGSMTQPKAFSNVSVLLAEDNTQMRRLLKSVLNSFGFSNVHEAHNGQSALEALSAAPIDLMLTDFYMEPLDGLDLIRIVRDRETSKNPYLPIIMVTGRANMDLVNQARDVGCTEFLTKPVRPDALYKRIKAIIERPRPFVQTKKFFGPCRRRRVDSSFEGPERRDVAPQNQGVA